LLYILDANVLITANRHYYAIDRVPEFWEWLQHLAAKGSLKMPQEIYEEIEDDEHGLGAWATRDDVRECLVFDEQVDINLVRHVVTTGYASDLTDDEIEKLGRDPFLIAYGYADRSGRTVVTAEVSKPKQLRGNRRVPDVCNDLGVNWCDIFGLTIALDFSTDWKRRLA
jgi:uncharacterized protein DUF4411